MPTGIKPRDVLTSNPTNPLRIQDNRVVSPTLGGSGNTVNRLTGDLDTFANGNRLATPTKVGTPLL